MPTHRRRHLLSRRGEGSGRAGRVSLPRARGLGSAGVPRVCPCETAAVCPQRPGAPVPSADASSSPSALSLRPPAVELPRRPAGPAASPLAGSTPGRAPRSTGRGGRCCAARTQDPGQRRAPGRSSCPAPDRQATARPPPGHRQGHAPSRSLSRALRSGHVSFAQARDLRVRRPWGSPGPGTGRPPEGAAVLGTRACPGSTVCREQAGCGSPDRRWGHGAEGASGWQGVPVGCFSLRASCAPLSGQVPRQQRHWAGDRRGGEHP